MAPSPAIGTGYRRRCLWTVTAPVPVDGECASAGGRHRCCRWTVRKEARHAIHRRQADSVNYDDDPLLGDEGTDDEAQNDADGGNEAEDDLVENGIIQTLPTPYQVNIGINVQLECKVSPPQGLVVAWLKDGERYFLGGAKMRGPDRMSIAPGTSDLLIKDVQMSDTGKYTCQIEQTPPVSIDHTLFVLESPRIRNFTASEKHFVEGQSMLLTCDVTGSPKPEILWSRLSNGMNHRLTEQDGQISSNSFYAQNITKDMSGIYFCYAANSLGHQEANVTVNIARKLRVHVHKTAINSAIDVEAVLQCSVHEESTPYIRWHKDNRLIEDSSTNYVISTQGSSSNLTVTPKSDMDFGKFTCEAENMHGTHSRSIDLVETPVIEDLEVDGPKITWTVHSHQPLEKIELQLRGLNEDAQWKALVVPLPPKDDKSPKYTVIYALDHDDLQSGKYEATVKVKNSKGWSSQVEPEVVDIETKAQPIQKASVLGGNAHSIRPTTTMLTAALMYLLVRMV